MRIHCPHCGERGNEEFTYLGDATLARPSDPVPAPSGVPSSSPWRRHRSSASSPSVSRPDEARQQPRQNVSAA